MIRVQSITIAGARMVILSQDDFDALTARQANVRQASPAARQSSRTTVARKGRAPAPPLPPADASGTRPAVAFARASIARDILRQRRTLNLSQQRLAALAGVRQETLSRIETAKHTPTIPTLRKIERALARAARR